MSILSGKSPRSHVWGVLVLDVVICAFGRIPWSSWEEIRATLPAAAAGDPTALAQVGVIGAFLLLSFVIAVRRLNDLQRSRWWAAALLVPVLNIAVVLGLLFKPGIADAVEVGSEH